MSKRSQRLRALVTERLTAAAEEIFALVERTIAEYEEELSRSREDNQRRQQLLEENQRRQQLLEENQRGQQLLEENRRMQQLLEENQRGTQLLEENQRMQQLLEESQRRQQLLEVMLKHQRTGNKPSLKQQPLQIKEEPEEQDVTQEEEQLLEENQKRRQLLEEALSPQPGAENHYFTNPTEETVPGLKLENWDNPQIHEASCVEVKEEDPEELAVTLPQEDMRTHWEDSDSESHMEAAELSPDTSDTSDTSDTGEEEVTNWTAPLKNDVGSDGAKTQTPNQSEAREFRVFPKNKTIVCSFCKMTFARPCQLKRHMAVHSCSFCQKICPSEKNLKLHVMLHTGERPFPCPLCDKRCRTRGFLNNHIKMRHSLVRPFSCTVCSAAFKSDHLLRQHMYQHTGRRPFECSLCEKSFKRKYELQNHMLKHTVSSETAQDLKEQV